MKIEHVSQKHFKATLRLVTPIMLLTFLGLAYFTYLFTRDDVANRNKNLRQSITFYQANISEKISILASSNTFIDFIRSGEQSRNDQLLDLKILFSNLKDESVSGLSLRSEDNIEIFSQGLLSKNYVELKLCYLNDFLNTRLGSCRLRLRISFDPQRIAQQLVKTNSDIEICHNCHQTSLISESEFGSFQVENRSGLSLPIRIKPSDNLKALIISEILLLILTSIVFFIIHREFATVSRNYLYEPIKDLVSALSDQIKLDASKFKVYEFKLLAESVNTFIETSKNQEAFRRKAELGELATQVAHDLRSPLGILKSIETDLNHLPAPTIKAFKLGINRLEEITDTLLGSHKKNEKNLIVHEVSKAVGLNELLKIVIEEKKIEFSQSDIQINYTNKGNAEIYSMIDRVNLKNIISNMINNSLESVKNKRALISIQTSCDNNFNCITIQDNGSGIPDIVLKKLFQKGFTTKAEGNGLGLYSAFKHIRMHSGDIKVESGIDEGTTFKIYLPKTDSNTIDQQQPAIVLIDDDKFIRLNWNLYFEKNSRKIITFSSIDDFLLNKDKIDLSAVLFVDSDLGHGIKGEIESEALYQIGFSNIYLSTGYSKSSIRERDWIKDVCSKNPADALDLIELNIKNNGVKLVAGAGFEPTTFGL